MSRARAGRRSPLLSTLFLVLWMAGISILLFVPLFIGFVIRDSEHITALLLAASALLPTFGASCYASIEKTGAKEYILSAVIAIFGHGVFTFALMAACSLLLEVENLAQVILLALGWIPGILVATVVPPVRSARIRHHAKRGYRIASVPVKQQRTRAVSILGGILFGAWFHVLNLTLYLLASADNGSSVIAGLIFPFVWSLLAVHRPRPTHRKAYTLSAILSGAVPAVITYIFAAILATEQSGIHLTLFDVTFRAPLTSAAIPLSLATLAMTVAFPLLSKASESTVIESLT